MSSVWVTMLRAVFWFLVAMHLVWTVAAFRGGPLPLLGIDSPGGVGMAALWFFLVYPVTIAAFLMLTDFGLRAVERFGPRPADRDDRIDLRAPTVGHPPVADDRRDPLTGTLTLDELQAAAATLPVAGAVAVLEVESLHRVVEHHGRLAAERALRDVAQIIRSGQASDPVGRAGEATFIIVMPGTDHRGAAARVERLLDEITDQVRVGAVPISLAAGVATTTAPADFDGAVERATAAMLDVVPRVLVATSR